MIPVDFVNMMNSTLGEVRAAKIIDALGGDPLVSVRVNPFKMTLPELRNHFGELAGNPVEWAPDEAFYLKSRPSFTMDPLFHTGAYYVQEASSMYVGALFDRIMGDLDGCANIRVLDLCAAPGGKTTQLLSHLPADGWLFANEVIGSRVPVLSENVAKWGCRNVTVTNSDASVFGKAAGSRGGIEFDVVVVDAPCSGEGMFRKGDQAGENWSLNNVNLCASRQRRILNDVWPALRSGGYMIYSTCTFNRMEDEDNVEWLCGELGAECIGMRHFYPGEDLGEGFFAALLRKEGDFKGGREPKRPSSKDKVPYRIFQSEFPEADEALAVDFDRNSCPVVDLDRNDALKFLAKEPLVFADQPLGKILLTYKGLALGFVKNLGRRSNSLLPSPRRIRNLRQA